MTSMTGTTIYLHDLSKSLAARAAMRKVCGPYKYTVPACGKSKECGFYFDSKGQMAGHGAVFSLRIEEAPATARGVFGYYGDEFQDSLIRPYVVRLNHGRGFLAACGEGAGMWGSVEFYIYADEEDAASAAHDLAESTAERNREWHEGRTDEDMIDEAA